MKKRNTIRTTQTPAAKHIWMKSVLAAGSAIGGALLTIFFLADMIVMLSSVPKIWTSGIPGAWKLLEENPGYLPPTVIVVTSVLLLGGTLAGVVYLGKRWWAKQKIENRKALRKMKRMVA